MVVPPLPPGADRDALRRTFRKLRQAVAGSGIRFVSVIDAEVRAAIEDGDVIGLYRPFGGEPDPTILIATLNKVTSLPALCADGSMVFRRWSSGDALAAAPWGADQPPETAPSIVPDVIFVPLLGFDAAFNRLGQGGGHYDRYLAAHPRARRIGVAWEAQRCESLRSEAWDVALDAIVTEKHCYVKDLNR